MNLTASNARTVNRKPKSASNSADRREGFTLVELLVALTLSVIISMTIMVISNTAREIYDQMTKKVELSNKFRLAW